MKIAIASDFHLGFNEDAFEQARRCLRSACESTDFVLLAGDLFDSRVPKQETIHDSVKLYKEFSEKLKSSKIILKEAVGNSEKELQASPLLGIYGTHERRAKGLSNIIQILNDAGLMVNVHARKILVEKISSGKRERVCVQGMGGVPEEMAAQAIGLLSPHPVEGFFNIFVFHQSVRELIPQDENALCMADLPKGFDLYVNGHIHWRQELKEAGKTLIIPGSTVVTQMKKNEANPKGYYVYDTDKRAAEFMEIQTRPFSFKELEFSGAKPSEVEAASREFLDTTAAENPDEAPLVKLKLKGTLAKGLPASSVDATKLEKEYAGRLLLSVEKQLGTLEIKEKIELLRKIREEKTGAKEMGLAILKKLVAENGADKTLGITTEELFELLSQEEVDLAIERLLAGQKTA